MQHLKNLIFLFFLLLSISVQAQWTTSYNNIFYNAGNVGINTTLPEKNLDINGTLQMRRTNDADVNNPLQNSGNLSFQTGYWDGSAQTGKWNLLSKRELGFFEGNYNQNKSKFCISQNDGIDRFVLNDNGSFDLNGHFGESVMTYDSWNERIIVPKQFWAGSIYSPYVSAVLLRGYNWYTTSINLDAQGISYTGTYDYNSPVTAHQFTVMTPFINANSNIATFANGAEALVRIDKSGNIFASQKIAIGTTDLSKIASYSLAVNGSAIFTKATVKLNEAWPDYVFTPNYKLTSLDSLKQFIQLNNHLPEVPVASDIEKNGIDLGGTQVLLLKKIEELTLIVIEQNERIAKLELNSKATKEK